MPLGLAVWLFATAIGASGAEASVYSLRWNSNANPAQITVEISGLEKTAMTRLHQSQAHWQATDWEKLFAIYATQEGRAIDATLPCMMGTYVVGPNIVRFQPGYPLERGVTYRAVFRPESLPGSHRNDHSATNLVADFRLPSTSRAATTTVTHVYPSGDVLPSNLLKFYIHFSAPMSRGRIYDHIHLTDDADRPVEQPFLEIDEELWNPEMTRLTLLLDPGRIKRGVLPLEQIGPALYDNKSYSLVIDRDWQDAEGKPLKEAWRKSFRTTAPDRQAIDPASWKIKSPSAGSTRPLQMSFPKPLDQALAQRMIQVTDSFRKVVSGESNLSDGEQQWTFAPAKPWAAGSYRIVVQTAIEDLAGNNIGKPFEVDLLEGIQRRLSSETVSLAFEIQ